MLYCYITISKPMQQLYFQNSFVRLYYDLELRMGHAIWNGSLLGAEFREASLLCLEMIDRFELTCWLGDNRRMKPILPDDLEWSVRVFVPKLLAGPMLRLANLPSQYEATREAINTMVEKCNGLDQQLEIREFQQEEEALAWLLSAHSQG